MFQVLGFAYGIQLSNDGQHFSEALIMLAFDSKCAICSNMNYTNVTCVENVSSIHSPKFIVDNLTGDSLMLRCLTVVKEDDVFISSQL